MISDLLQSSSIQTDIEKRAKERVDALAAERAKELQSIETLQHDKANLAKGIERLRDETDKKTKAVRSAIQKAFANTRAKELESLGELAVFEALLSRRPEPTPAAAARASEAPQGIVWGPILNPSNTPLDELFREFGLKADIAERADKATRLGIRLGLPVCTTGIGANYLGTQLAAALCTKSCLVGDVKIGLLSPSGITIRISEPGVDAILLRNANLSDLSVYGSDLLSLIFQSAVEKAPNSQGTLVLLTCVTGPAGLSMPEEIRELAFSLDLLLIENALASPKTSGIAKNAFWRRLTAKVEKLEESEPEVARIFADLQALMGVVT
jgi:hypothetical protein